MQSSFLWGYLGTNVLGGKLADAHGGELFKKERLLRAIFRTFTGFALQMLDTPSKHELTRLCYRESSHGLQHSFLLFGIDASASSTFSHGELPYHASVVFTGCKDELWISCSLHEKEPMLDATAHHGTRINTSIIRK